MRFIKSPELIIRAEVSVYPDSAYLFSTLRLCLSVQHALLLVFASLVLEPDADDPRTQTRHLHQPFFENSIRSWVHAVAREQHVELRLAERRPHTYSLLRLDGCSQPSSYTFST